jgi:hypothetical protein
VVFTPENAPAMVLGFLASCLVFLAGGAAAFWFWWRGKKSRTARILEAMGVIAALYGFALLAVSLTSQDRYLEPGQLKYFCEIDCHLAYTVTDVTTADSLEDLLPGRPPSGVYYVVTVRTWFDERTITQGRGNSPLRPNPREVLAVDERGRRHLPVRLPGTPGNPLLRPLRPGDTYTSVLVFDIPRDARHPHLLITEDIPIASVLIGHENSLLHRKIWFRIEPTAPVEGDRPEA